MVGKARVAAREIVAAVLAVLSPAIYFIVTESSNAGPYQTTAGHGLLLISLPIGLVLIWLIERRPPAQRQPATPVWARLLIGIAAGLLFATALMVVNAASIRNLKDFSGTSLGTSAESGAWAGHAMIRLDDGRSVHLLNTFCGVHGSRVTVSIAQGLLGLDRLLACSFPSLRPSADKASDGRSR